MSKPKDKKDLKKVVTSGPPVSGMFAPDQENLLEPTTELSPEESYQQCLQCGYCSQVCRVYNTTFSERDFAGGRFRIMKSLDKNAIKFDKDEIIDAVYRCMLCGNCHVVCPVGIDTLEVLHKFRREAVRKGVMPDKLRGLNNSIQGNHNPYLESKDTRFDWCQGNKCDEGLIAYEKGKELMKKIESGELDPKENENLVGYFVGCTSAYRNNELVSATCRVLDKLGVEFVLFPDEKCCGSVLFRTGLADDAMELVKHNIDLIRKTGIKTVLFSCAGCFSTFSREYVDYAKGELGFDLSHTAQFIGKVAKEKNLKIKYKPRSKDNPLIVTYHDPCHLARYTGVIEEPRELMNMIEGLKFIEMKHNRDMSWCCGAGGGVRALYGEISSRIANKRLDETIACWDTINEDRVKEAMETEAETLLSACVFCKNNLALAVKESNSDMPVLDITQILEDCEITKN